jgi:Mg/Co/Ni transporter MgtE
MIDYVTVKVIYQKSSLLDHIRKAGEKKWDVRCIYIVDDTGYLIDDIRLVKYY